ELKELAPRPHVGAVVRDVDRRIAEEPDAARTRLPPQSLPLSLEEELEELLVGDFLADLALDASEGSGIAIAKARVPGGPRGAAMEELERGESRPVAEPRRSSLVAEGVHVVAHPRRRGGLESFPGAAPHGVLPPAHRVEIDRVLAERGRGAEHHLIH